MNGWMIELLTMKEAWRRCFMPHTVGFQFSLNRISQDIKSSNSVLRLKDLSVLTYFQISFIWKMRCFTYFLSTNYGWVFFVDASILSEVHQQHIQICITAITSNILFFSCGHATLKEASSVGPSVRWSVRPTRVVKLELKTRKSSTVFRVLQLVFFVCECVGGGWRCGWGEAGGWMPLPTRPLRYCEFVTLRHLLMFPSTSFMPGSRVLCWWPQVERT